MNTYEEGDYVYLFGFSRGAFTVRALSGMLEKCGLPTTGSENLIPYAARLYNETNNEETAAFFKKHFALSCTPHMIGVFDTVSSLGLLYSRLRFFNQKLTSGVRYGYHAISIDEKRPQFPVSLWDEEQAEADQTIEQVWFAGVHSDVGGGYARKGLSDIALEWMLDKAEHAGLVLNRSDFQFHSNPHEDLHTSLTLKWQLLARLAGHSWDGGNPRSIPSGACIHDSVRKRMEAISDYHPALPDNYQYVK